jgi:bacterioferritin-associated ferredoxin
MTLPRICRATLLTIIRIRVHNKAMIVCVCKAVSDRHIRSAVNGGISSVTELSRKTGLGTCCGKCVPEARATIAGCLAERDQTRGPFGHTIPR